MKVPSWIGMTTGPCGKIAGLIEMEQNATAQAADINALDELSEESLPPHPGQPTIPPIETAVPEPPSCAICIGTEATACPASPMPKATSTTSARRRASGSCLMDLEITPAVFGFKARLNNRLGSRFREPQRNYGC